LGSDAGKREVRVKSMRRRAWNGHMFCGWGVGETAALGPLTVGS